MLLQKSHPFQFPFFIIHSIFYGPYVSIKPKSTTNVNHYFLSYGTYFPLQKALVRVPCAVCLHDCLLDFFFGHGNHNIPYLDNYRYSYIYYISSHPIPQVFSCKYFYNRVEKIYLLLLAARPVRRFCGIVPLHGSVQKKGNTFLSVSLPIFSVYNSCNPAVPRRMRSTAAHMPYHIFHKNKSLTRS